MADRSLDKPYSSRSKALSYVSDTPWLIPRESPRLGSGSVGREQPAAVRAWGSRLASPRGAAAPGGLVLALMTAEPPLAVLTRQSVNANQGSVPVSSRSCSWACRGRGGTSLG
jgi:hypothetical protein